MALTKAEKQKIEDLENKIESILNTMQNEFLSREKKYSYFEEKIDTQSTVKTEENHQTTGSYIIVKNERRGSGWIETVMNNQEQFIFCSPDYNEGHRFSKKAAIDLLELLKNELKERNKGRQRKEKPLVGLLIKEVNA